MRKGTCSHALFVCLFFEAKTDFSYTFSVYLVELKSHPCPNNLLGVLNVFVLWYYFKLSVANTKPWSIKNSMNKTVLPKSLTAKVFWPK